MTTPRSIGPALLDPLCRSLDAGRTAIDRRGSLKAAVEMFREALRLRPVAFRRAFPDVEASCAVFRAQSDERLRGAFRIAAAVTLAASDPLAPERLFAPESGWNGSRREDLELFLLYEMLARGDAPWERARLIEATRHADAALRLVATECRLKIALHIGIERDDLYELLELALGETETKPDIRRGIVDLVWQFQAFDFVEPLFDRFPKLTSKRDPIMACLLARVPQRLASDADRHDVRLIAETIERVDQDTAAFWNRLAEPGLRVAVVGNSSCETGLGRGSEIDAHDLVVRFNLAPEHATFAADYGARCDVKVFNVFNIVNEAASTAAPILVLKSQSQVASPSMAQSDAFAALGKTLAYVPAISTMTLRRSLGSPLKSPTTGLIFLAQLRAVRASLKGVSLYGFSLVDQLDPSVARHYYAPEYGAGVLHDWRAERAILDDWLAEAGAQS